MRGGTGNDSLLTVGATVYGDSGNDYLDGVYSSLYGGSGNDTLNGEYGIVDGGSGDDQIEGNDARLVGGLGRDTIAADYDFAVRYNSPSEGGDTINRFYSDDGDIEILASGFKGSLQPGQLSSSQFVTGFSARDSNDQFIYNSAGSLFFDVDGRGGSGQVQLATLTGDVDLSASDLVIV